MCERKRDTDKVNGKSTNTKNLWFSSTRGGWNRREDDIVLHDVVNCTLFTVYYPDGIDVGWEVGSYVGLAVGVPVGLRVGSSVGLLVGSEVKKLQEIGVN